MSILNNCLEYLLGVSERIITKCADKQTSDKYFKLKEQVMDKCKSQLRYTQSSGINSDKQNGKSSRLLRISTVSNNSIVKSRKSATPHSIGRNIQNKKNCQPAGVQFSSCKKRSQPVNSQNGRWAINQYAALVHVAAILKNAQCCPSMLKTITFKPNNFSKQVDDIVKSMAQSLISIYQALENQKSCRTVLMTTPCEQNSVKIDQLLRDNKWLLSKLQAIINENIILRRMAGLKVND